MEEYPPSEGLRQLLAACSAPFGAFIFPHLEHSPYSLCYLSLYFETASNGDNKVKKVMSSLLGGACYDSGE
jgi:hypothetical protein